MAATTPPPNPPVPPRQLKLSDHALIDLALERNHETRKLVHVLPAPGDEFRLVAARAGDVDLAFVAGKAQCEPFLRLPAILALPGLAEDVARDVVGQPVRDLAKLLDRADVGLLVELAQRRLVGVLALVDAALRHLPGVSFVDVFGPVGAPADEDAAAWG